VSDLAYIQNLGGWGKGPDFVQLIRKKRIAKKKLIFAQKSPMPQWLI